MSAIEYQSNSYQERLRLLDNLETSILADPELVNHGAYKTDVLSKIKDIRRRILQEQYWDNRYTVYLSDSDSDYE